MSAGPTLPPMDMFPPPPPPGMNYLAVIEPALNLTIIGAVWMAALVPLLIALFLFSDSKLRKRPIFIFNVLAVVVGIVEGIINFYIQVNSILSPLDPLPIRYTMIYGTFISCIPLFVESILVIRVLAVYPPSLLSFKMIALIYLPIVLFKIARVADLLVFFLTHYPGLANGSIGVLTLAKDSWSSTASKLGQVFQMLDNGYCSALFLDKIRRHGFSQSGLVETNRTGNYISRLRALFWIAVTNFVFPVILAFVQLVMSFKDSDHLHGTYLNVSNAYVNIIGVVFATVWSAGQRTSPKNQNERVGQEGGISWGGPVFASHHTNDPEKSMTNPGTTMTSPLDLGTTDSSRDFSSLSVLEEENTRRSVDVDSAKMNGGIINPEKSQRSIDI